MRIRQSYGRRYVEKKMRKKRMQRMQMKIFFVCLIILSGVFVINAKKQDRMEGRNVKEDQVAAAELAGYLQAACLTPEETRKLVLSEVHNPLTAGDVQTVLEKLGMESNWDEFVTILQEKETDEQKVELQRVISREKWCQCYERLLEKLQVKDSVTEVALQYLGKVPGEQRIMANNGNYDCDLQSCQMLYGKQYVVYVQGNLILGVKNELMQKPDGGDKNAASRDASVNNGEEEKHGFLKVPQKVRVLLTQDHGQKPERQSVFVTGSNVWTLRAEGAEETFEANTVSDCGVWMSEHRVTEVTAESADGGKICLTDENGSVKGSYDGGLHIYKREDTAVYWVVNELGMEAYLYGVVPGEMPSSFAPEALKAQAVCARTYASMQVLGTSYEQYHADVNDTTACQVYLPENENQAATEAVNATAGQILTFQGMIATVYYFSTSCGYTIGLEAWQQEPVAYLQTQDLRLDTSVTEDMDAFLRDGQVVAYDSESRFFRWKAVLQAGADNGKMLQILQTIAKQRDGKVYLTDVTGAQIQDTADVGSCTGISIANRADSGCVTDLCLNFAGGTAHIYNENAIRKILWSICVSLTDKNGNSADTLTMLPSAFFSIDAKEGGRYEVYGGGLGHGIGMSQYGADGMAKSGMSYADILTKFFPGTVLYQE